MVLVVWSSFATTYSYQWLSDGHVLRGFWMTWVWTIRHFHLWCDYTNPCKSKWPWLHHFTEPSKHSIWRLQKYEDTEPCWCTVFSCSFTICSLSRSPKFFLSFSIQFLEVQHKPKLLFLVFQLTLWDLSELLLQCLMYLSSVFETQFYHHSNLSSLGLQCTATYCNLIPYTPHICQHFF